MKNIKPKQNLLTSLEDLRQMSFRVYQESDRIERQDQVLKKLAESVREVRDMQTSSQDLSQDVSQKLERMKHIIS